MPNPPVGCVLVRDGVTLGEGWHHRRGEPHAEAEALRDAHARGNDPRGATAYVSLEPCNHVGRTPPCSEALIAAQIARVVIGALDPNPKTAEGGVHRLRAAGIDVDVVDDPAARALIERFRWTVAHDRPYVTLKMAASLDGYVAARAGVQQWLTGPLARERVRELRVEHDAVMVGAGTIRVDDAQLTVRPHATRRKPYARVVVCETDAIPATSRVLAPPPDAPPGCLPAHDRARAARRAREVRRARAVRRRGVRRGRRRARARSAPRRWRRCASATSRPSCAKAARRWPGRLLARRAGPAHRLAGRADVPALPDRGARRWPAGDLAGSNGWRFDRIERVGDDMLLSADLTTCSPA